MYFSNAEFTQALFANNKPSECAAITAVFAHHASNLMPWNGWILLMFAPLL
jgi:hypothetical protein